MIFVYVSFLFYKLIIISKMKIYFTGGYKIKYRD